MQLRLGFDLHLVARMVKIAIETVADIERHRREIADHHPHRRPGEFRRRAASRLAVAVRIVLVIFGLAGAGLLAIDFFRGLSAGEIGLEQEIVPAHRGILRKRHLAAGGAEFGQGDVLDGMHHSPGRIDHLQPIVLLRRRGQGLVVLVADIELVLDRIARVIDALGRGAPGQHMAETALVQRKEAGAGGAVAVDGEGLPDRQQRHVAALAHADEEAFVAILEALRHIQQRIDLLSARQQGYARLVGARAGGGRRRSGQLVDLVAIDLDIGIVDRQAGGEIGYPDRRAEMAELEMDLERRHLGEQRARFSAIRLGHGRRGRERGP